MTRTQTADEKRAAIISVLPLLHAHLGLICDVRSGLGQLTPSVPDGPPRMPPVICSWHCPDCAEMYAQKPNCPPEEAWVRVSRSLARQYRLYAVARSLDALHTHRWDWARSVYYEHIEPWPNWNPLHRAGWALEGVAWMADEIPDDVPAYGLPAPPRLRLSEEVRMLRAEGLSHRQIAKRTGASKDMVRRLLDKSAPNGAKCE